MGLKDSMAGHSRCTSKEKRKKKCLSVQKCRGTDAMLITKSCKDVWFEVKGNTLGNLEGGGISIKSIKNRIISREMHVEERIGVSKTRV